MGIFISIGLFVGLFQNCASTNSNIKNRNIASITSDTNYEPYLRYLRAEIIRIENLAAKAQSSMTIAPKQSPQYPTSQQEDQGALSK